jgi:hypothetical protein
VVRFTHTFTTTTISISTSHGNRFSDEKEMDSGEMGCRTVCVMQLSSLTDCIHCWMGVEMYVWEWAMRENTHTMKSDLRKMNITAMEGYHAEKGYVGGAVGGPARLTHILRLSTAVGQPAREDTPLCQIPTSWRPPDKIFTT